MKASDVTEDQLLFEADTVAAAKGGKAFGPVSLEEVYGSYTQAIASTNTRREQQQEREGEGESERESQRVDACALCPNMISR